MKYYFVGIKGSGFHECLALFSNLYIKKTVEYGKIMSNSSGMFPRLHRIMVLHGIQVPMVRNR